MKAKEVLILIVEDNPADLELTLHALKKENLSNRIQVARDGEEALDFIYARGAFVGRATNDVPKLILLDLKLPKVDGLGVLQTVKSDPATRAIPVVILTASKEESDLITSYQLGVNSYIQKPVEFDEFRKIVRQFGLYWLLVNEGPPDSALAAGKEAARD